MLGFLLSVLWAFGRFGGFWSGLDVSPDVDGVGHDGFTFLPDDEPIEWVGHR